MGTVPEECPGDSEDRDASRWRYQRWAASGLPWSAGHVAAADPTAEVRRLGCVQAQEFEMSLWSLGQRTGATQSQVLAALSTGEVLRTHAMRPTWHFVHRDDLSRVHAATADRVHQVNRSMYASQGPGSTHPRGVGRVALRAPGGRTPDTRRDQVPPHRLALRASTRLSLVLALMWAELESMIISGPPRGMTHTYQAVPTGPPVERDESIRWLVETFLSSHGPSSIADICAWSGLKVADARAAVADLRGRRAGPDGQGETRYWIGPLAPGTWPDRPTVGLLNGFDEYISGLAPRSKSHLDPDGLYRERPGTPLAMLMIDGALAGHWRRTSTARTVRVSVILLRPASAAEREELELAAERYARYAGLTLALDITDG